MSLIDEVKNEKWENIPEVDFQYSTRQIYDERTI